MFILFLSSELLVALILKASIMGREEWGCENGEREARLELPGLSTEVQSEGPCDNGHTAPIQGGTAVSWPRDQAHSGRLQAAAGRAPSQMPTPSQRDPWAGRPWALALRAP